MKTHVLLFILGAAICLALAVSLFTMTLGVGRRRIAIRKRLFEAARAVPRVLESPTQATRALRGSIGRDAGRWALLADSEGRVMARTDRCHLQSVRNLKATHRREADALQHMIRRSRSGGYVRFLWSKSGDEALTEYVGYVEERMCGKIPCILMMADKDLP